MGLNATTILTKLRDHAAVLGIFEHVVGHAMINPPPSGLGVAYEFGDFKPSRSSGLAATSGLVVWTASIFRPLQTQPADDIETEIVGAAEALINAYSGDFELGGNVRCVDLLGAESAGLTATSGYFKQADIVHRSIIVSIPLIQNDVFTQAG